MMPEQLQRFKLNFNLLLKSFLVMDALFVLLLTVGFAVPKSLAHDGAAGSLPRDFYDDSAKISPFTPPDAEPARVKASVPVITARGAHPTFVPPPETAAAEPANAPADDLRAVPASVGATVQPAAKPAVVESVEAAHTS